MKGAVTILTVVGFSLVFTGVTYGWNGWVPINVGCVNAWSGATDDNPEYGDPKDLANDGHLLNAEEKASIRYWDEDVYTITEPAPPTDYTYMIVTFADDGPEWDVEDAYLRWSYWVDVEHPGGREENKLLYWDGVEERFIQLDSCEASSEPSNEVNVWVAFENNEGAENVIFLIYGYTPYPDETWAKCNTVNLDLCVPHH